MNINFAFDIEKCIYNLRKVSTAAGNNLDWQTNKLTRFLVVFAHRKEDVDFNASENQKKLTDFLASYIDELREKKTIYSRDLGWDLFWVSHDELRRFNGIRISENPGIYGVYGIEEAGGGITVYLGDPANPSLHTIAVTLDVVIDNQEHYIEKGFFKKTRQYSGFHCIRLDKPYPDMAEGSLKYVVDNKTYTFPDEAVKQGGSFFVYVPQGATLLFSTGNPGIRIK